MLEKKNMVSSSKKIISSLNVHVWHHTKTTFHPFHDCKMNSIYVRHISHDQRKFSASNISHLNFLKWTSSSVWMGFYDFLYLYFFITVSFKCTVCDNEACVHKVHFTISVHCISVSFEYGPLWIFKPEHHLKQLWSVFSWKEVKLSAVAKC